MFKLSENIDPNKIFIVNHSELEGRIDPFFYKSEYSELEKKIEKSKYKKKLLKELIYKVINGLDFRDYDIKGGIPYIKVANIKKGFFDFSNLQYITPDIIKSSKDIQLEKGNLLLTRKGTFGNALCLEDDYNYIISSEVFYLKVKQSIVLSKYLEIYFNSNIGQKFFKKISIGAIMGSLSQDAIKSIKIPLPPLEIQQQIVDLYKKAYTEKQQKEAEAQRLLDSIDDYLLGELGITLPKEEEWLQQTTNKHNSYNLDNDNPLVKKGRLFLTNLSEVTGKRIDPDYNKIYYINLLNAIKFVNNKPLKDLTSLIDYGLMPTQDYANSMEEGIPFIRVTNILNTGYIDMSDIKYIPFDTPRIENKLVKENDILMVQCGSTTGKVAIVPKQFENYLANSFSFIIRSNNEILQEYLFYILNSSIIQKQIKRSQNIVSVRPNTSKPAVENLLVPLPPLEKQNEIATHISQIRSKANVLMQQGKEILEQAKQEVERMILGN
ncbi:hypothetical protein CGC59_00035 [Capnocytophaga sputigena]|uniref:Type I restriction modification DNA specificity domain-containing protein n=1 Tax=Capnocytophaga sputigena TaxID=1019 RepID=A0A250F2D2_CAPSP|nr:restriction endonuclease subunit S [Capnocytophaga sputigena]ATA78157.1 hypothetical protein CGC59_00035 [Capnocytophaga sputigena]